MSFTQEEVFADCEKLGESKVREHLGVVWSHHRRVKYAKEWIRLQEESRKEASSSEQIRIARSAKNAAWAAAIAAIIAMIAAVISVYLSLTE